MKIAIDWDGVIADFLELFRYALKRYYDINISIAQINEWDLGKTCNIPDELIPKVFGKIRSNELYATIGTPVDANFAYFVKQLQAEHECFIVTRNPPYLEEQFKYFLKKYDLDLPIHFVKSMEEKRTHDFDILVDDCHEFVDMEGVSDKLILYRAVQNMNVDHHTVAWNWKDVVEIVNGKATVSKTQ